MVTDGPAAKLGESLPAADECIRMGPVPDWVVLSSFVADGEDAATNHLLHDRQIHAELRQTYFHVALRLDSMQTVHDESPWRLDFEPRTQQVILHSIRTWRAGAPRGQADLSAARIMDRRVAGTNPPKPLTLSIVLEDVRLGDILEWSYTVENRPSVLPDNCAALFALPAGVPVGKFSFSLIFDSTRPMQWRSSVPEWEPVKSENEGRSHWVWTRENYPGLPLEDNRPEWHMARPWIQISDCPNWGMIAAAYAAVWPDGEEDSIARETARDLGAGQIDSMRMAEKAIQLVQDEYRCTAVDGELDGQPPAPPGVVARRRYGDGKDLSFLLAHLLRALGLEARLVLINTVYRQSLASLLPAPDLFNHLLVEFTVAGQTRWVDATRPRRAIDNYGVGLALNGGDTPLARPPAGSVAQSAYELAESILVDTAGGWSWLAVVVTARGPQADALRQELESAGLDALARKRLQECARRFVNAKRAGALECRDNRAANEFFLAEIFEIKDFLKAESDPRWRKLEMPNDYIANFLKTPDVGPRHAPFALPHPCHVVHTIELHSVALAPAVVQQRSVKTNYVDFTRVRKTLAGFWTMKLTLSTLADAVPPESLEEHRQAIREIRKQSVWSILLPAGDARPHRRSDFGALPEAPNPARPAVAIATPSTPVPVPATVSPPPAPVVAATAPATVAPAPAAAATASEPETSKFKRRKRHRRGNNDEPKPKWPVFVACAFGLTLILITILVAKNADHWNIFQKRPAPPGEELNTVPER
jgi:transglutaminase-like putative cysteine protease